MQSWEEITELGATFLLRTCLAKGGAKDGTNVVLSSEPCTDTNKLKKMLAMIIERLQNGGELRLQQSATVD